jgi:UDP-N-acetylglucosamine 2-epimerase (non-hydrolysing)
MPEEINRIVTDSLADLLLTPSSDADENLKQEGVPTSRIRMVGNIMIDSLIANLGKSRESRILNALGANPREYALVTLHRPSNVDEAGNLSAIMNELRWLSRRLPVIFPMHPRTQKMLLAHGIDSASSSHFQIINPVGYLDSLCLTENARLVLTDSGGLQEETTYFQTPCLTLRPNTERPVTLTQGTNQLTDLVRLRSDFTAALERQGNAGRTPPLWDGMTSERCLRAILMASNSLSST